MVLYIGKILWNQIEKGKANRWKILYMDIVVSSTESFIFPREDKYPSPISAFRAF